MPNFLDAPEILPLPSLQAYSSISFLFLSCSLYYAFQITSEPDWKTNSSYIFPDYLSENITNNETLLEFATLNDSASRNNFFSSYLNEYNVSALYNEFFENPHFVRFFDVAYVMVHEPLCVWTLINMGYCLLILVGKIIQKLIFGDLRASEHQLIRDKFWNFLFYKFIFVFSVINVQYMDELILWCSWFSILGFMFLLTYLCKERFNYLTFSPAVSKWIHFRLLSLLCFILILTIPLFVAGVIVGFHTSFSIGAFLISECLLLFLRTLYCVILYAVHLWDISRESIWEKRASINYYIELTFDLFILFIDFCHHLHMLFWGNIILSVSSLVILIQLRAIFNDINRRIKKHRNYLHVLRLMEENFPVASNDELVRNNDDCAICWDHMVSARKLPCGHLFHTTCLRSWLEQDTSCPTCRHSLRHREEDLNIDGEVNDAGRGLFGNANIRFTNHFFHFDGPRYSRWLPTVSVEVTPPNMIDININATLTRNEFNSEFGQQQIEYMGQQVLEWFPQTSLSSIMEDLRVTRSVEHTIENILDGRLRASTSNTNSPQIEENISSMLSDVAQNESNSDSVSSTESSDSDMSVGDILSMPSTSSTSPVHKIESSNVDSSANEECDTTNLENRFMKLSSDERKRLLTRRKEEMFQKARNRFIQNNTLI